MTDDELAQALIDRGLCSLEQVREAAALQQRRRRPLAAVLVEKGYVAPAQLAALGIAVEAPPPRRPARSVPKKPFPWVPVAVLAVLAVGGIAFGGKIVEAFKGRPAAAPKDAPAGPTAAERADADAKDELDRIDAYARAVGDFENAEDVARRFADFMRRHAGRKWELDADRRLKEYRAKAEAFAKPRLDEILARDAEYRAAGRLADLVRLYRAFPAKFLHVTDSGRVVKEKVAELTQRMREAYVKGKAEAERLRGERSFEAALDALLALAPTAPDESLQEVADLKTRIESEWRTATAKVRQEVADAYLTRIDGPFKEALLRRDPRAAAAKVAEFLNAPWGEDAKAFVRAKKADYEALRRALGVWDPDAIVALCEAAIPEVDSPEKLATSETALLDLRNAALVGQFLRDSMKAYQDAVAAKTPLEMPSLGPGRFEKRGEKTVYVGAGGRLVEAPLGERDLAYLLLRGGEDGAAHARVGFFYFYSARDMHDPAYQHLVRAVEGKAKGVQVFLGRLVVSAQAERGRLLQTKLGAAEDCFKSKQWEAARKLLGEMLEESEHPFVKEQRRKIEAMLFDISEGTQKEKELAVRFKGRVRQLDGGKVQVAYDFQSGEQADAFEVLAEEAGRRFKGRWRVERGAMESSSEASVMLWKTPLKGDLELEADLTPLEDPQNVAFDLYYRRGQSTHYAVVMGFDWIGRADGDPGNTVEDRFGMPRTCVIKYPVSVDKGRWVLADHWENWTRRLVGRAAAPFKPAKGKTVRLKIERAGRAIRLSADQKPVWEGEDGDYGEGALVFFSDSRVRLDNLLLTVEP